MFGNTVMFGSLTGYDRNRQALSMIESILEFSEKYNRRRGSVFRFNTDFPISVRSWINDDHNDITEKQFEGLQNIIRKWKIRY